MSIAKKIKGILFCVLLGVQANAAAIEQPKPNSFCLGAEFICFQPILEDTFFALGNNQPDFQLNPVGNRYRVRDKWEPGYRLEGVYGFENEVNDIRLRWTQLNAHGNRSIASVGENILMGTQGFPNGSVSSLMEGTADSNVKLDYESLEFLLGQVVYDNCGLHLTLQGGVQYARFKYKNKIRYSGLIDGTSPTSSTISNCNRTTGVGPELVLLADYALPEEWCCGLPIRLTSRVQASLLVHESRATFFTNRNTTETLADVVNDSLWRIVPAIDFRFGLSWTPSFCWGFASLEVGYEVMNYQNALQTTRFYSDTLRAGSFDHFTNIGFHGPYVALSIGF